MVQSNFCNTDLSGVEKPAATLTQFVDYIFGENADRWQAHETLHQHRRAQRCLGFILRCQTGQQSSESQAGRRGGGGEQKGKDDKKGFFQFNNFFDNICRMYNFGKCFKPPGTCATKTGIPLMWGDDRTLCSRIFFN